MTTQRVRFIGINPERGTKAIRGKVVSKKMGVIVQKKSATVNTHVSTRLHTTELEDSSLYQDCPHPPRIFQKLSMHLPWWSFILTVYQEFHSKRMSHVCFFIT
ncbi:hypothetical protein OYC64_003130 [Pagothenia borchgrevinki]|uniref:Uncharacterized protein n=1 Tax=Pagothenia borchgrevinki TaxID=8213 RepID=A0ABD2HAJ5_PAGBO